MNPHRHLIRLVLTVLLSLASPARAAGPALDATFTTAATVPVTDAAYTAAGNTVNLTLGFTPVAGTKLTVVNNTGMAFIQGVFDNLAQGQAVDLTYGGVGYRFVANYYGGSGNDLVLQWAGGRLLAWGGNSSGVLGNNSTSNSYVPVPVDMTGVLAGKTLLAMAVRTNFNLALCADGSMAAWGYNSNGQLGNNSTTFSTFPVQVTQTGVLAGKTVIAVCAGGSHGLALCADGTLASWGYNNYGQLGNNSATDSTVPVLVNQTGALAGKTVVAVTAGTSHSLVLCSDGTMAAWGYNNAGQLGDNSTTNSSVPVLVKQTGILSGKSVIAIAGGAGHGLALCSDGTLAAWGQNDSGQLGNNSTSNSSTPVWVTLTGVLAGKSLVAVSAGAGHNLALCADGTPVAWGNNYYGQLGNNSTTNSSVPVQVDLTGVLAGRTIIAGSTGNNHSLALCADGTMAAWGYNTGGQLGNTTTTNSKVPVLVDNTALKTGDRAVAMAGGSLHSIAMVASPPPPIAITLTAGAITDTGCVLNGSVNAQGTTTAVTFEYGPTLSYGITLAATPASLASATATAVSVPLNGLLSGTTYHYRVIAASGGGTVPGADMTFTTGTSFCLSSLTPDHGTLFPAFDLNVMSYVLALPSDVASITLTPLVSNTGATVTVAGTAVASGSASGPLALTTGNNRIDVAVTAAGGGVTRTYTVTVTRLPAIYAFASSATVPVTVADFLATGNSVNLALNFVPVPGTDLTVVRNTGANPIQGAFTNLARGQTAYLTYNGVTYAFVANYCGGSGNDLVLHWANTRLLAWGDNSYGQHGNNSKINSSIPVAVDMSGALAGKSPLALAAKTNNNLALCADGSLAAWGDNASGQLGNNSTTQSTVPVWVTQTGVLADRTVTAIAEGGLHGLALCADGTLAAWGSNNYGMLGNNSTTNSTVPVLVNQTGVLAGRKVIAIAGGGAHSLVLCEDGTLASWGKNSESQLGNNSTYQSKVPVQVMQTGVLAGKKVIAIAAGGSHNVVLCADGTLATWGYNNYGQLGNNSTSGSGEPVLVTQTGVLVGKTVVAVAAGVNHSLVLCSDGAVAAWGYNIYGQLGNNSTTQSTVPVWVTQAGVMSGKPVVAVAAGDSHSLALCSDGTLAAWGYNNAGQLGNNSTSSSSVPVLVSTTQLQTGERFVAVKGGTAHGLARVASLPAPIVTPLAASSITDTGATLNSNANANGSATAVSFEYGLTTTYGTIVAAAPASLGGTTTTPVSATVNGLLAGLTYHYRLIATSAGGTVKGADMTFTTNTTTCLSGLTPDHGSLMPAFDRNVTGYAITLPSDLATITLTPVVANAGATVTVGGVAVLSGSASGPLSLTAGNNRIDVVVTAAGGGATRTYSVTVTRLPATYAFDSPSAAPVTTADFLATGNTVTFALNFTPAAGTELTVVRNTGVNPIQGVFSNLAQWQTVNLTCGGVTYPYVANYYGGSGNDLVLQWANTRLLAWGDNSGGALGNNSTISSLVPAAVDMSGVLAGKSPFLIANGTGDNLVLCLDGTLAAWGSNSYGQLGNNSTTSSTVPVGVTRTGVLAGKTVVALAAGTQHQLALCSDGTMAAWGRNDNGQLGNNSTTQSTVPVGVDLTGVLAGRTVIAIAGGGGHNLALCADGTLAAWGFNMYGQLGNNSTTDSKVPVLVNLTGVLAGKSVTAIAAGGSHNLVLCSDGTLVAWGAGSSSQLGNGGTTNSSVPVLVNQTGVLAGRTVTAIAAGGTMNLALCADGAVAQWGRYDVSNYSVPALVDRTGVLVGKTVTAINVGANHSFVLCSDGTLAAWGNNMYGQLGNNSTSTSNVPVLVNTTQLKTGERFSAMRGGYIHSLALVASPPPPVATTLTASAVTDTGCTLGGRVNANGSTTAVSFEYGLTTTYGTTVAATPASLAGTVSTTVSANPGALLSGSTYHFRVVAASPGGTVNGADMTFTTSTAACLSDMTPSHSSLTPAFERNITGYVLAVPYNVATITLTPVVLSPGATVAVDGTAVESGAASGPLALALGNRVIDVAVTAAGGGNTKTYSVTVTRLPEFYQFNTPSTVPVTVTDFQATGNTAAFALNFVPTPGIALTVVRNTGFNPIQGTFANLAQWQQVNVFYQGIGYPFVANYFGGNGNDLVLQWANTRLVCWGSNSSGQLGNNSATTSYAPVPVTTSGVLAGKTIVAIGAGYYNCVALCADGTLAAWGAGTAGQLGNGISTGSLLPVLVNQTGVLAGRTVIAISVGSSHSLVLCSDGTLAAWGAGTSGQLGNSSATTSNVPVLVNRAGVLAGKRVTAIAAGGSTSMVLCSDGTLAAWGGPGVALGNNSNTQSTVPVLVDRTGVLAGKTVTAISSGGSSYMVMCTDGTMAAWGSNYGGKLGNGAGTDSYVPVPVNQTGVLAGKTMLGFACGGNQSVAVCSDGTLTAWGYNYYGQLGNNNTSNSYVPVLVNTAGVLSGKIGAAVSSGESHSVALCSDGTMAAWGYNNSGQLGNTVIYQSQVPVAVNASGLAAGERFASVAAGSSHNLAMVAAQPASPVTTLAATVIRDTTTTLNGNVNAQGNTITVSFDYGLTTSYGSSVAATPATISGTTTTTASAALGGLLSGTTYHYRISASGPGGTATGQDMTFTTTRVANLSNLSLSAGTLQPAFAAITANYGVAVPYVTGSIRVTPVCATPTATVKVNGASVTSGTASTPINLAVGANAIPIVITSADGLYTQTYTVTVTRLPEVFTFTSPATVPVTAGDFTATGLTANFSLGFAPAAGTVLTVVRNTGGNPIRGFFGNLAQGQRVTLGYGGASYGFVANYFGGTGNDLVLQWANTRLLAWGGNSFGQLGDNSTTTRSVPVPVDLTGVLAGKTVIGVAEGGSHGLALCSDGTVAAWGYNGVGQLGNNKTIDSGVPVAVDLTGVLAGKTVVALSAGDHHSMALCSDGTVAAWGYNNYGQLGNNSTSNSQVPVPVNQAGALAGKTVMAIAAGRYHGLALCSDGTLAAWGRNDNGQLGNYSTIDSRVPVLVNQSGVLAGKTVTAIAAGSYHSLALCADGTLAAWGSNGFGNLGNNSSDPSNVPVLVDRTGVLAGKRVASIAAGSSHSMALCSDGTLAGWGYNFFGQLGNIVSFSKSVPVLVDPSGALAGKTVLTISTGTNHTLAVASDGTMAAWGENNLGQLGNNSFTDTHLPVAVNTDALTPGERFVATSGGSMQTLALVASPPSPAATTLAATAIRHTGATLNGNVNAGGGGAAVSFEYGLTHTYGMALSATPASVGGAATTAVSATLDGLGSGVIYHYRVVTTGATGTVAGDDMTFTTTNSPPVFPGYAISTPYQREAVISIKKLTARASDADGDALSVTAAGPASAHNGTAVMQANAILYTPADGFSGDDTFAVTLTDAHGAGVTGTVTVTVEAAEPGAGAGSFATNPPRIAALPDGRMEVRFHGIPGRSYQIQRSTDMAAWTFLATVTANADGSVTFTDDHPPQPSAFYRLALPN